MMNVSDWSPVSWHQFSKMYFQNSEKCALLRNPSCYLVSGWRSCRRWRSPPALPHLDTGSPWRSWKTWRAALLAKSSITQASRAFISRRAAPVWAELVTPSFYTSSTFQAFVLSGRRVKDNVYTAREQRGGFTLWRDRLTNPLSGFISAIQAFYTQNSNPVNTTIYFYFYLFLCKFVLLISFLFLSI